MTGREAVELCRLVEPHIAIPVHYEGWSHFKQGREDVERAFAAAPDAQQCVSWIPIGTGVEIPSEACARPARAVASREA